MRSTRNVVGGDEDAGMGHYSDPPMLVLASLANGPKHGYAMVEDIVRLCGTRLGQGTLYGAIARLEQQGWIEPLPPEERRRPYRITADGLRVLRARLTTLDSSAKPDWLRVMKARLARLLTRLYPRAWRERYGAKFESFLESGGGGVRASVNVLCSTLCEHIFPTQGGEMEESPRLFRFHFWCVRAPWAVFSFAPLLLLAGAYFIAWLYLWSGWTIFLPGADTPFGVRWTGAPYALQKLWGF